MIQWVPYGPHALLLRFASRVGNDAFAMGRAIIAELEKHPPHGLVECVPGFTTVLLQFDPFHSGNISLTGQHVAAQLADLLNATLSQPVEHYVLFMPDPDAAYGDVLPVLNLVRMSGTTAFCFGGLEQQRHLVGSAADRPA